MSIWGVRQNFGTQCVLTCAHSYKTMRLEPDYVSFLIALVTGIGAALCAVSTSGLAGVLCELRLKGGSAHVTMSIRNIQLGLPSCLLGLLALLVQDSDEVFTWGVLQGFTRWTWTVVALHSIGV